MFNPNTIEWKLNADMDTDCKIIVEVNTAQSKHRLTYTEIRTHLYTQLLLNRKHIKSNSIL